MLPLNLNTTLNSFYANLPTSPEMKTIDLPAMTPRRGSETSDISSRSNSAAGSAVGKRPSGAEVGSGILNPGEERDRWSGSTAVGSLVDALDKVDSVKMDKHIETTEEDEVEAEIFGDDEDAEEAKINRKVSDDERRADQRWPIWKSPMPA